jgi:alpha-beta hydrolase superfamily lysophospholipase
MRSYEATSSWQRYREILQRNFGVVIARDPSETWRMIRGHNIHIDHWQPDGPPKGTLILVHGGGGNGRILAPLGDHAASIGWQALAPDLPGYGLTEPASDFRWDYDEWPAVVAELADEIEGPVVLLGASVGGLTAAFAAAASGNVAGVIATTLLDMSDPSVFVQAARWRWLGKLSLVAFRLFPAVIDRIALPLWISAPLRAMSDNVEIQNYFARDPLIGRLWVPVRFFRTMHARRAQTITPKCPLILVHPGADAWTPTELSRGAFARVQGPKEIVELTNGSHLPLERPAIVELYEHIGRFLASVSETRKVAR